MSKCYQNANPISAETSEESIKISIATTVQEKTEIYHFRYQIYVEEMSKELTEADHENKLLYDELDEEAIQLAAKIGTKIIATVRIHIGQLADFPPVLIEQLSLNIFQNYNANQKFSFCSKLMVSPAYRNSPATYLITARCCELSNNQSVSFIFLMCNLHLIRFYEKIGCHRIGGNYLISSGLGIMTPLVISMDDAQHLRNIRSPLMRIARKKESHDFEAIRWFYEKFVTASRMLNSQLVTKEALWSILCSRLGSLPTDSIPLLENLSVEEAKIFLHCCGTVVPCAPGDYIISQGTISYSYDILLTGKLRSLTFLSPVKEYSRPGQHFGADGLTEHGVHTEDIAAVDTSDILKILNWQYRGWN
jgi:predicted GNAT family N-acyltransferase